MSTSVFQPGNTAVITGGASGVGLALAQRCLVSGMKVLVADLNDELLGQMDSNIATIKVDVGNLEDWAKLKTKVEQDFNGKINLLALNAGIAPPTSFTSPTATLAPFHAIITTNLFGVLNGIHTLLPLIQQNYSPSAIIITGSKQGITNPPSNPAYNASKAAVKTLAEHLSFDLRESHPQISVHLLVPGWTHTGLTGAKSVGEQQDGGSKPAGAWYPAQVVDYLVEKMGEGRFYVICPDNEVSEEMDKKRMLWAVGDIVEGRPALTRWRGEWKDRAMEWMERTEV